MFKITLLVALAGLTGCAATYTEPTLSADHPANAAAMESTPPPRSRTLDLAGADPVTPAAAMTTMDHSGGSGMGGHGMDAKPKPPADAGAGGVEHPPQSAPPSPGAVLYACPMHPEVTSDKPDQRCPKCGMRLKKVESAPTRHTGGSR